MEIYRWLCTESTVILGPYEKGEMRAWLTGLETMRTVHGTPSPGVILAATRDEAQRTLDRKRK
jgi:hypothetical protein